MLRAIIVDDEENSRSALKFKIGQHCPEIEIVGEAENGETGISIIEMLNPDILFLDVEMPKMNGFSMLQKISNRNFEVIFITGYSHYAINAIKVSALDYIIKPVEINELIAAVNKASVSRLNTSKNEQLELLLQNLLKDKEESLRIAISSAEGVKLIETSSIIYLAASSNYTHFFLTDKKKYIATKTLKEFEEILPENIFIRIHHSYIINKKFIEKFVRTDGAHVVMKNGVVLPVAKRKKGEFLKIFGK